MFFSIALARDMMGGYQVCVTDILPFDNVSVSARSEEGYADAITQVHKGLAYMGLWGVLYFFVVGFDAEDRAEAQAAIAALTDEEETVTPEDTERVRREIAEDDKRINRGLEKLIEFMQAQAGNDEEEHSITVEEALRRAKEGNEQIRRIVEGEESGADPEGDKGGERPSDPTP
jgi:hypothetical protein